MTRTDAASLVEQYTPLVRAMSVRRGAAYPWLIDDFISDATLALWRAAAEYDPAVGEFVRLARVVIRYAINKRVVCESRRNRAAFRRAVPSATIDEPEDYVNIIPDGTAPVGSQLEAADLAANLLGKLPPDRRREVVRHVVEGDTLEAIGAARGVGGQAAGDRIRRDLEALAEMARDTL